MICLIFQIQNFKTNFKILLYDVLLFKVIVKMFLIYMCLHVYTKYTSINCTNSQSITFKSLVAHRHNKIMSVSNLYMYQIKLQKWNMHWLIRTIWCKGDNQSGQLSLWLCLLCVVYSFNLYTLPISDRFWTNQSVPLTGLKVTKSSSKLHHDYN